MAARSNPQQHINIDIVSDLACPWCFIGKKKLDLALSELDSKFTFSVRWEPYLLRPDTPPGGGAVLPRTPGLEVKLQHVKQAFKEVGLELKSRDSIVIPYTLQGHMLLDYVEKKAGMKKQNEMAEILFKAYFIDGKSFSLNFLLEEACKADIDTSELKEYLENPSVASKVKERAHYWSQQGIGGVPFFIFNGRPSFSGAQDPQVFKQTILKVAEKFPVDNRKGQSSCL